MSKAGAAAGVGVGLAIATGAFVYVKRVLLRPRVTTRTQMDAYDYAVKLRLAMKHVREGLFTTNESADVVHNRVYWMIEQWVAVYNRLQMLPADDSTRLNFGSLTSEVASVIIHVAQKHGREIRGTVALPAPLAKGVAAGLMGP